jgi:antitoxin component of MazEF toxin-antitoxin module
MDSYVVEIQENDEGDCFITLPDDLIDTLGWQEGDILTWRIKNDSILLSRIDGPAEPDALEKISY